MRAPVVTFVIYQIHTRPDANKLYSVQCGHQMCGLCLRERVQNSSTPAVPIECPKSGCGKVLLNGAARDYRLKALCERFGAEVVTYDFDYTRLYSID